MLGVEMTGPNMLDEHLRIRLWRMHGVAFDAHMNVVSRMDEDPDTERYLFWNRYPDTLMMRLDNCDMADRFWNLNYPVCDPFGGIIDSDNGRPLSNAVAIGYQTPLGRAIRTLQWRIRFHTKARKARRAIARMLCQWSSEERFLDEAIVDLVTAYFITMHPRAT